MRTAVLAIVGGLALILGPALSLSQPPGGRTKGKGPPSSGGGASSKMKSSGKGGMSRPEFGPRMQEPFGRGTVPSGNDTMPARQEQPQPQATSSSNDRSAAPSGGMSGSRGGRGNFDPDAAAASWFRRQDRDGDGVLSFNEIDAGLQNERDNWDLNGDGFIDLNEFMAYSMARMQQWQADREGRPDSSRQDNSSTDRGTSRGGENSSRDELSRPLVYRPGNLPSGLPSWFEERDRDRDGQIGLYEWRASGERLDEFQRLDINNDGFVTAEELLRSRQVADARAAGNGNGNGNGNGRGPGAATNGGGIGIGAPGGSSGGRPDMRGGGFGPGKGPGPGGGNRGSGPRPTGSRG
jgi:hypothetical protein